jgi:pyruvate,orthophosphate dikinase
VADRIYRFSKTECTPFNGDAKKILGGKGAGLRLMAKDGLNVPPGFTITTEVCNEFAAKSPKEKGIFIENLLEECVPHLKWLADTFGFMPLVSVRSGAPVSMPGMMDTILNVGLTTDNFDDWSKRIGERTAYDSQRRLIQMLGSTGYGIPHSIFEEQLEAVKKAAGVKFDAELGSQGLINVGDRYLKAFKQQAGFAFPLDSSLEQLRVAIRAVFESWMNPRAIEYRKLNNIDPAMGTAVNVQAMVFGNGGEDSGTGVLFTRNPSTGIRKVMGEFLTNAQGEDVVAGIRTPVNLDKMPELGPQWEQLHHELMALSQALEVSYHDMVDVEFTVQQGTLFVLQSRTGKRSARAAFKIATDLVCEGVINENQALVRLTRDQFKVVRRPSIDPSFKVKPDEIGLPACPGVATGRPVFSSKEAVNAKDSVILVTHETTPDDIAGMHAAAGILTQTGGATSHAAVVARAMDKTCVVGCTALDLDAAKHSKKVTIDGATGRVWFDIDVPVLDSSDAPEIATVIGWCYAALDAVETVVVPTKGQARIAACEWWGDVAVLDAVLVELSKGFSGAVLDLTPPTSYLFDEDISLLGVFGASADDVVADFAFRGVLYNTLLTKAKELAGLQLTGVDAVQCAGLIKAGYVVGPVATAVPSDFAVFSVLAA